MKRTFEVSSQGILNSNDRQGNLTIFNEFTRQDQLNFIDKLGLPRDVFELDDLPYVAPRLEYIDNESLGRTLILVLANVMKTSEVSSVEKRMGSHTFILGEEKLYWFMDEESSQLDSELFASYNEDLTSFESILMYAGLLSYSHFADELEKQKEVIDKLHQKARKTTRNEVLVQVSETERDMVLLEHAIETQEETFTLLLEDDGFLTRLDNEMLVYDIKWYNRQVKKLVHVYRDLLESVSGLFSDIMSNNLNKLMKFLSSLSLILASTSLIAEIWGMNTGGLPFENHNYGTSIMVGIAILSGFIMYFILKNQEFFDD